MVNRWDGSIINLLSGSFTLPSEHHIRQIMVSECDGFISLLNFDRIYSVRLVDLRIYSLEGLGSHNRVVEVDSCPFITDFSPLRHCDKVSIRNCRGFQDINQVRSVKDLIFSPDDANKLPTDMEGVTCLIFIRLPKDLLSVKFPSTLKTLGVEFTLMASLLIQQVPLLLASLPRQVSKIEIEADEKLFHSFLNISEDFTIEFKEGTVHFLRKLE